MSNKQSSTDAIVERFKKLPTAAVSDALDRLRLPGAALGIKPLFDGARVVGRAFIVRYAPAGQSAGTVGDYIDDLLPGAVVVLDNAGRTDCTVWGDILISVAHERGIAGTVVSGVRRDVSTALGLGCSIFSWPVHACRQGPCRGCGSRRGAG